MDPPVPSSAIETPARGRDQALDRLRGLAIVLMIIDHALVVVMANWYWANWEDWTRTTLTRVAMPLFMVVSGLLIARKGRPSLRRIPQVVFAAIVLNEVFYQVNAGFTYPEILAIYILLLPLYPLFVRYPIEVAALGILQFANLPITWDQWQGYQPGEVLAFLALGSLLNRHPNSPVLKAGTYLPRWLGFFGRHPLVIYTAHLLFFVLVGVWLQDNVVRHVHGWF
jgi:surface polysaccharide O-acyltransferase-like enzyme